MTYDLLFVFAGAAVGILVGWATWHKARHKLDSQREDDVQVLREMQRRIRMAETEASIYKRPPGKH